MQRGPGLEKRVGRVVGGEPGGGVVVPVVVDEGHALEVGVEVEVDEFELVKEEGVVCGGVDVGVVRREDAGELVGDLAVAVDGAV